MGTGLAVITYAFRSSDFVELGQMRALSLGAASLGWSDRPRYRASTSRKDFWAGLHLSSQSAQTKERRPRRPSATSVFRGGQPSIDLP